LNSSQVALIKIKHEFKEAVQLVLLQYPILANRPYNILKLLPLVRFKSLDRIVRHVYDHNIVA
jgi:hypothetical protein